MPITLRWSLFLFTATLAVCFLCAFNVSGQTVNLVHATESAPPISKIDGVASGDERKEESARLVALEAAVREQHSQLDELRKLMVEQQETIRMLTARLTPTGSGAPREALANNSAVRSEPIAASVTAEPQTPSVDDRLKKVEGSLAELGRIKFSGDFRLRSESFFGVSNNLASGNNPAELGNDLSPRHRMRVRARLALRGSIGNEFDWGLRLATGSFADNISTNQTLTDFFDRKPFALDQAFITYKPKALPGVKLQGGKFEPPWNFTELTIDNDLMVEGFNESYTRTFKGSKLREVSFVAWQLPFLERNSAFVRNADGTVNIERSERDGKDLAMFGGQARVRFEPSEKVAFSLSAADLYFRGTQFISPVQVFGSQLQLPVVITIPATATTPAQIITTQVSIPRDFLVAGNANLGLTNASNNAINRDGRLASGFNLVDLLARLELKHSKRWPVTLLFDFVTNTRVRDVVTAGPGGADLILPNNENHGFWGEVQVGSTRERGDMQLGYTFMRIEKDAVLTPFNFSDVTQQSDMRAHRLQFSYAADPRVTFSVIGIVTQRPHGVAGAFGVAPLGSAIFATTRLQFDTVIRF
ncbi:MAG TPA: putative porin [Pyrinomonadaceae bacterium]|nr:putative porin [Pyrinomonadaceae bacterium]